MNQYRIAVRRYRCCGHWVDETLTIEAADERFAMRKARGYPMIIVRHITETSTDGGKTWTPHTPTF